MKNSTIFPTIELLQNINLDDPEKCVQTEKWRMMNWNEPMSIENRKCKYKHIFHFLE